jgi:hypothetical protein
VANPYKKGKVRTTDILYENRTAETLSLSARIFRDAFIREYIKDFNATKSLIRLGCENHKAASVQGCQLLREPYVAKKLDETIRQLQPTDVVTRQQVMAGLWEEANSPKNYGDTRVRALAHIGKMLGMGREENQQNTSSGVMLVPMTASDDWGKIAAAAQAILKSGVAPA